MRAALLTLFVLANAASAQAPSAGKPPAARPLGAIEAKSTELLGSVSTARALSDGKVLVNDALGRRVLLFDKSLASYTVVADTTPATGNAYASRLSGLIPYKGDTSLFIDPQSMSMLVVDPAGKIGRVMSVPRPQEANSLIAGNGGIPGFDSQGRLVYRAFPQFRFERHAGPGATTSDGRPAPPPMPTIPDSMAVVRIELATRKLDTLAFVKTPTMKMTSVTDTSGRTMVTPIMNPLPQVDDWAVLSDGSVAIIRGLDYHVEFFKGDGSKVVSERLPFEWRHLDDSAKQHFVDSAKVAMEKLRAAAQAQMAAGGSGPPRPLPGMDGGMNVPIMVFRTEGGPPGGPPRGNDNAPARDQGARTGFTIPPLQMVPPNELPDYAPPFNTGAARADQDGNLWIRTSIVVGGGPVYDVISESGKLVDRVVLPPGRVIAGFGKGGIVFMGVREENGVRLEQARRSSVTP